MSSVTNNRNEQDIVNNWDHPINLTDDKNLQKLLQVVALENNRIDLDIEEIYDSKFLKTATGKELEKLGDLVGVNRKTTEGDIKLRKRIQAEFAAQASDTTYEIKNICAKVSINSLTPVPVRIDRYIVVLTNHTSNVFSKSTFIAVVFIYTYY